MRFCLGLALAFLTSAASAQTAVPRIRATVVGFDSNVLTVMPAGESQSLKIGVRPATRIMKQAPASLGEIRTGDFIGATLDKSPLGALSAREVHIFPETLRGSGEGLYPAGPSTVLGGTVTNVGTTTLGVKFRGATGEGANCAGRAPLDPLAGCQGAVVFAVPADAPVMALVQGDKSLLVPGAVLAVSIMAGPDGKPVTPGLTVENAAVEAGAVQGSAAGFAPAPEVPRPFAPARHP